MAQNLNTLCNRKSTRYMKIPLKSTEQIYLIFLIPAVINCIIYILHFSADLVVAIQHFRAGNPIWGYCTLAIIYTPALSYFILTVSRPDWWMTDDDKVSKGILGWFGLQVCQFAGFVFFVLYRYAGLIVLSVDAAILSGDERVKTLNIAAAPAAIELYFFLQAWFQAAPQAVFQTHLLFRQSSTHRSYQSVVTQVLCIIMSIVVLAIETASFQRFESQRMSGRKLPWAMWLKKYRVEELRNIEETAPLQTTLLTKKAEDETSAPEAAHPSPETEINPKESAVPANERQLPNAPASSLHRQISMTPPLPPKNVHVTPPPTPLRGITTVTPLPIPDLPAPPRPDSVHQTSEQEMTETPSNLAPQIDDQQRQATDDGTPDLKIPVRKYSEKGLEEDDPMGKFLSFLWWFLFILARVFTIAVAYEFYPWYVIAMLGVHYVITLFYLFHYAKHDDVITFFVNLWLGLVYLFSLIEYRIKFKYSKLLLLYYIFVMVQNTAITLTWYIQADWDGFWYTYIFYFIFGSMLLCVLSSTMYHLLFKPKKCRVYSS